MFHLRRAEQTCRVVDICRESTTALASVVRVVGDCHTSFGVRRDHRCCEEAGENCVVLHLVCRAVRDGLVFEQKVSEVLKNPDGELEKQHSQREKKQ